MEAFIEILKKDKKEKVHQKKAIILFIFTLIFFVIYKIIKAPFTFLKYKLFKKDRKLKISSDQELINTEKYRLTLHEIDESYKNYALAKEFYHSTIDNEDDDIVDTDAFVVKSHKFSTVIDDLLLADFGHQIKDDVLLQQIRFDEQNKATSDLICFNIKTNEVKQVKEIGLFLLDEFDEEKSTISGFNLNTDENILVHLITG